MTTPSIAGQAIVGQTVVGLVAIGGYIFNPPTVLQRLETRDRLFSRKSIPVGVSVLKSPLGTYAQVQNPTPEQIDAATICYLGGHVYEVDYGEAAALTAAGYTVTNP